MYYESWRGKWREAVALDWDYGNEKSPFEPAKNTAGDYELTVELEPHRW